MPSVYLDATATGDGSAVFSGGNSVLYVSVEITTVGPLATLIEPSISDHLLRLGWFALGDAFDTGIGTLDYWREIVWCNFVNNLWTPLPSADNSGSTSGLASRIRWWFGPGTTAHIHVLGL